SSLRYLLRRGRATLHLRWWPFVRPFHPLPLRNGGHSTTRSRTLPKRMIARMISLNVIFRRCLLIAFLPYAVHVLAWIPVRATVPALVHALETLKPLD